MLTWADAWQGPGPASVGSQEPSHSPRGCLRAALRRNHSVLMKLHCAPTSRAFASHEQIPSIQGLRLKAGIAWQNSAAFIQKVFYWDINNIMSPHGQRGATLSTPPQPHTPCLRTRGERLRAHQFISQTRRPLAEALGLLCELNYVAWDTSPSGDFHWMKDAQSPCVFLKQMKTDLGKKKKVRNTILWRNEQ